MPVHDPYTEQQQLASLSEELNDINNFIPATTGARFLNLLIDFVAYYLFLIIVITIITSAGSDFFAFVYSEDSGDKILYIAFNYTFFLFYYTAIEGLTKGRSAGKYITGTRVVRKDGSVPGWLDFFQRSLCRIVPFEVFSGFGTPWHDAWTGTQVVKVTR